MYLSYVKWKKILSEFAICGEESIKKFDFEKKRSTINKGALRSHLYMRHYVSYSKPRLLLMLPHHPMVELFLYVLMKFSQKVTFQYRKITQQLYDTQGEHMREFVRDSNSITDETAYSFTYKIHTCCDNNCSHILSREGWVIILNLTYFSKPTDAQVVQFHTIVPLRDGKRL
jgi:hypothetical protein